MITLGKAVGGDFGLITRDAIDELIGSCSGDAMIRGGKVDSRRDVIFDI